MNNILKIIFLFFFISSCLCCCYSPRYVYSPSTQNIPTLHRKNDLEFSAFYAGSINAFEKKGNSNSGFDMHVAWAVSNHFAAILNESFRSEKNGSNDTYFYGDSSLLSYKSNFTEFGAGYYNSVQHNDKMQFQVFGGVALGSSNIFDEYNSNGLLTNKYHKSSVTKIFIQPSIIYSPLKFFSGTLTSRFTEVVFTHIHTNYTPTELDNYILDSLTVSPVFFWEPSVSYTFAFKKLPLKLRVQGSISVLLNHRFVEHKTGNIAFGLIADFSKKRIRSRSRKN
jgi:hypothetical protein